MSRKLQEVFNRVFTQHFFQYQIDHMEIPFVIFKRKCDLRVARREFQTTNMTGYVYSYNPKCAGPEANIQSCRSVS